MPQSWVPIPTESPFGLENLPYGVGRPAGERDPRVIVRVGDHALDTLAIARHGLLDGIFYDPVATLGAASLNPLLAHSRPTWERLRSTLTELLVRGERALAPDLRDSAITPVSEVELRRPINPPDFVDFYSSIDHATNVGKLFRPSGSPLLPNWRHVPVGYHGRAQTVVANGTQIVRPLGQWLDDDSPPPAFGPCRKLDFELEIGFVIGGPPNAPGQPIPIDVAHERIFGLTLLNDWSARDVQSWEYQPLGPFLSKSFATSVGDWVVPLAALKSHRLQGPTQKPEPLPYLQSDEPWAFDIALEVWLNGHLITETNFSDMYWTVAQQFAHLTSNGAVTGPGDLCGSGTISGAAPGSQGSLLEITFNGEQPIEVGGEKRGFLLDGDTIVIHGEAPGTAGRPRIGFGDVIGRIAASPAP